MAIKPIFDLVEEVKDDIENLSVEELKAELDKPDAPDVLVADIREIQERVDLGTIPGAKHVPRGMLEFWADPQKPVLPRLVSGRSAHRVVLRRGRSLGFGGQSADGDGVQRRRAFGTGLQRLAGSWRGHRGCERH